MWNRTGRSPVAPFEIIAQPGADYFIKLVEYSSSPNALGQGEVAIFVQGGQRLEVEVPLGRYTMRYAAGETRRGEVARFGPGNLTT